MDATTEMLGVASATLFAAALAVLVRLHLLPTGRDPRVEAVSDYGVGPHHRHYRALVVLLGVGAALLVVGLVRDGRAGHAGLAWLAAYAAARVAIAGFMTDLPGRPLTTAGRVHAILAALAFTSIAFASSDLTSSLADEPGWDGSVHGVLHVLARAVAVTAVATLVAYVLPQPRRRVFGLVERLLYVSSLGWLLTASIHLAALAG